MAACCRRFSITAQGLRLSDREIKQKSWPSGAPALAAVARAAETPGSTSSSTPCQVSLAGFPAPPLRQRPWRTRQVARGDHHHPPTAGGQFEGVSGALQLLAVVAGMHALIGAQRAGHLHVGVVAEQVFGPSRARRTAGVMCSAAPGPRPTTLRSGHGAGRGVRYPVVVRPAAGAGRRRHGARAAARLKRIKRSGRFSSRAAACRSALAIQALSASRTASACGARLASLSAC